MTLQDPAAGDGSIESLPSTPRWLSVLVGVGMLLPAALLLWAAVGIPIFASREHILGAVGISLASLLGVVLCLSVAWRLILNRSRADGGLLAPWFLRVAAGLFVAIPIAALATGSWRSLSVKPEIIAVQMLIYFGAAIILTRLARSRRSGQKTAFGETPDE